LEGDQGILLWEDKTVRNVTVESGIVYSINMRDEHLRARVEMPIATFPGWWFCRDLQNHQLVAVHESWFLGKSNDWEREAKSATPSADGKANSEMPLESAKEAST
jgi:hypothetical protein